MYLMFFFRGAHFEFGSVFIYKKKNQTCFKKKPKTNRNWFEPKLVRTNRFRFGSVILGQKQKPNQLIFSSVRLFYIKKTINYIVFWGFFFVISNGFDFGSARFCSVRLGSVWFSWFQAY